MIQQRNPLHAIPNTTTFRFRPVHLPAPSHRHTASRPASRRTVSPDGSAQGTTPSGSLLARSSYLLTHLVPSHRLISSAYPFRPLLARLISRTPSPSAFRPIRLVHLIHLIRLIGSSPTPHRIRRATSRRNGAHDGQSTTGKEERHDIRQLTDTANAPPRPPYSPYKPHNARTLPRTRPQENAPYMPITTPLTGNTG